MLIIRFARRGRKGQAFFDIVLAEKSRPVKKKFIAKLGYFNPIALGGDGELVFDKEAVEKYIKDGAQCSQSVARLLAKNGCELAGKFIQARVTKPKKEAPKPEVTEEVIEEAPAEEVAATEEAPKEKVPEKEETPAPEAEKTETATPKKEEVTEAKAE